MPATRRWTCSIWQRSGGAVVCGNNRLGSRGGARRASARACAARAASARACCNVHCVRINGQKTCWCFCRSCRLSPALGWASGCVGLAAFAAFCLCASSAYLLNDLLDIEADRVHPSKYRRPIAAGDLSVPRAFALSAGLLVAAFLFSALLLPSDVSRRAWRLLAADRGLHARPEAAHQCRRHRFGLPVHDARARRRCGVVAGALVLDACLLRSSCSSSLAAAKRTTELEALALRGHNAGGRARLSDTRHSCSACPRRRRRVNWRFWCSRCSCRQISSAQFRHPQLLWAVCPLLLLWINRVWMKINRGEMHDDPVVFALRDALLPRHRADRSHLRDDRGLDLRPLHDPQHLLHDRRQRAAQRSGAIAAESRHPGARRHRRAQ